MREEILLDLLFTKEERARDVKVKGCCSYSDHEVTVLGISMGLKQKTDRIPGLRRASFSLFGDKEEHRHTAQFCRDRVKKAKA